MNAFLQQLLGFFRRYPFVIVCSALAILLWVANYFIWQNHKELAAGHQTLQRSGEDMLQSLTGHTRVTAEMTAVTSALEFIERNLLNEADLAENLGYFYAIESTARIRFTQLNQLSSQPQPVGSLFKTVPFALKATGSYRQIMRLLHEMETGPRQLRVRTYSFNQGESGATDTVTMELNVEVLALP